MIAMSILIGQSSGGSSGAAVLLPLVLMGGIFYFLLIRPQQRRSRQQRALIDSLDVGDEVITIGGLYGTIREVDDESISLEVAPGTELRFVKSAIARKLVFDDEVVDDTEGEEEDSER